MLAITHLVVSLLLIQLLTLDKNDAFVALLFGVFIDIDHLIGLSEYARANGLVGLLDVDSLMNPGGQWKSLFHNPMAVAVVAPVSIGFRLAVPLLFWGVHVLMDIAEDSVLGLFSATEATILVLCAAGLLSLRYAKYVESYASGTVGHYLRMELDEVRGLLRRRPEAG